MMLSGSPSRAGYSGSRDTSHGGGRSLLNNSVPDTLWLVTCENVKELWPGRDLWKEKKNGCEKKKTRKGRVKSIGSQTNTPLCTEQGDRLSQKFSPTSLKPSLLSSSGSFYRWDCTHTGSYTHPFSNQMTIERFLKVGDPAFPALFASICNASVVKCQKKPNWNVHSSRP